MTLQQQEQIANSFSDSFEEFPLGLLLSKEEFLIFDKGIFSTNHDEKWNIFVYQDILYLARMPRNYCIYKAYIRRNADQVILEKGFVTKDRTEYNSDNIQEDRIGFLKILQSYLRRDDIYVDPAFEFDIIKQTLAQNHPINRYRKSIGRQSVRIFKAIYQSIQLHSKDYTNKTGWTDFNERIKDMNDDEELLSLYLHHKTTNQGKAYHFDKEGNLLSVQLFIPN